MIPPVCNQWLFRSRLFLLYNFHFHPQLLIIRIEVPSDRSFYSSYLTIYDGNSTSDRQVGLLFISSKWASLPLVISRAGIRRTGSNPWPVDSRIRINFKSRANESCFPRQYAVVEYIVGISGWALYMLCILYYVPKLMEYISDKTVVHSLFLYRYLRWEHYDFNHLHSPFQKITLVTGSN